MSLHIRGIDPSTRLIRRPGGTLRMVDDGSWEGREKFTCSWSAVRRLSPIRNRTPHPDFNSLLCTTCEVSRQKAGMADLDISYRGLFDVPEPTEQPTVSTGEQPVETHDLFRDITEADQAKIKKYFSEGGDVPALTGNAQKLLQKKLKGIESYVAATTMYRITTLAKERPTTISDVGEVYGGIAVDLPNSYMNWLKVSKTWRRIGGLWAIDEDYQLSGRNGWDPDLY